MILTMLKGKIHRAVVTQAELNYMGSITIDKELMDAAGIIENEKVQIVDNNNGARFETYVIPGKRNSGIICLNGAAARMVQVGDEVIIIAYAQMEEKEAKAYKPKVVFMNKDNTIQQITNYEYNE
ncbi:MAG: aspartate 1-decarboxylase [Aminipila sp.]